MRGDDMTDTMADRFFAEQEAANSGTSNSRERGIQRLLSKFEDTCRDANLNEKGQEKRVERLYRDAKRMPPSLHGQARAEAGDEVWGMIVARNVRLENRTRQITVDDLPEDKVENWEKHRVRVEMHKWDLVAPKEQTEPCDQCRDNRRCCQLTAKNELDLGCRSCLIYDIECNRPWRQLRQSSAAPLREGSVQLPLYARLPSVTSDIEQFPLPLPHFPKATPTPGPSRVAPQIPNTRKNTPLLAQGTQRKRKNNVMAPPEVPSPIKKRKRDNGERANIDIPADSKSIASQIRSFPKHSTDVPWLTALRDAILKLTPGEQEAMRIDPKTRNIWETLIALEVWKLLDCIPFPDDKYNLVEGHVGRTNILLWDLKGTPVPSDSACTHCAPGQCQHAGRHSQAARCRRCILKNINGCRIPKPSGAHPIQDSAAGPSKRRHVPDEDDGQYYIEGASPTKPSKRPASPAKRPRKSVLYPPNANGEYPNELDAPKPKKGRSSHVKTRPEPESNAGIADIQSTIKSADKSEYRSLAFLRSLLPRLLALSYNDQRILQLAYPELWAPLIFVLLSEQQGRDDTATQEGLNGNGKWSLNEHGKLTENANFVRWDLQAAKVPTGQECRTCIKKGKECEFTAKSAAGFRGVATRRCRSCILNGWKCLDLPNIDILGPDVLATPMQQDSGLVCAMPPQLPLTHRHTYPGDDDEGSSHEGASTSGEPELRNKDDALLDEIAEMIEVHGEGEDIPWLRVVREKARRLSPAGTKRLKANNSMFYTQITALDIWDEQQYDPAAVSLPNHLQWMNGGFMNGQRLEDWDSTPVAKDPCSDCRTNGAVCYCPPVSGPAIFDLPPKKCRRCMFKTAKGAKCDGTFAPHEDVTPSRARPPMATGISIADRQPHLRGSAEPQISYRTILHNPQGRSARRGISMANTRVASRLDKRTSEADDSSSPTRKKRRTEAEQTNNLSSEPLTELSDDEPAPTAATTYTEVMAFLRTRQKNFSKTQTLAWETLDVEWLSALRQRVCALSQAEQSEFHNKHPLLYAQLIFISLGEGDRRLEGTFLKVPSRSENLLAWDLVPPKIAENCAGCPPGQCERLSRASRSRKCRACWLKRATCQIPRLGKEQATGVDEQDEDVDVEVSWLPGDTPPSNDEANTPQLPPNDVPPTRHLAIEKPDILPSPTDPNAAVVDAAFLTCNHPPTLHQELVRVQAAAATHLKQAETELEESRSKRDSLVIRLECANSQLDMARDEVLRLKSQIAEQTRDELANASKEAEIAALAAQVADLRMQKDLDDMKIESLEKDHKEIADAFAEIAKARAMDKEENDRLRLDNGAKTGDLLIARDSRDAREAELRELRTTTSEQFREKEDELQRMDSIIRAKDDEIRVLSDQVEGYKEQASVTAMEVARLRENEREMSSDMEELSRLVAKMSKRYHGGTSNEPEMAS